jgi:hypothetical protein
MRPVILLLLFCMGLSSCNIFAQGQTKGEPPTTLGQPLIEPTTTPEIFMPIPAEQRAFEKVRATLAGELGVDPLIISLVDVTPVDWPDSCLGLPAMEEMCAQVVTPGYRVRVQEGGMIYEFHTDSEAKGVRQVK